MKLAPDHKIKKAYIDLLQKEFTKAIRAFYANLLIEKEVINSGDALEDALLKGIIKFSNSRFTGKFNSSTVNILKKLGATYRNGYFILHSPPTKYLSAIAQGLAADDRKMTQLLTILSDIDPDRIAEKADIEKIVEKMVSDLQTDLLPTVKLKLDDQQSEQVRKKYMETTKLHIKGWAQSEVEKLRVNIRGKLERGERYEQFFQEIQKKYKVSPQKALFWARQETNLLQAEIKEQTYLKAGFSRYIWRTRDDSKVRPDHALLDGTIQDLRHPPIVDQKTGRRANAQQDYNCRCFAQFILD